MKRWGAIVGLLAALAAVPAHAQLVGAERNFGKRSQAALVVAEQASMPNMADIVGAWERVPFPEGTANKSEPWPLPYQYFRITEDGRIGWMMSSKKAEGITGKQLTEWLDKAEWQRFEYRPGIMLIFYRQAPGLSQAWALRLVPSDTVQGTIPLKAGDLLMTMLEPGKDGRPQPVYVRQLRRIPD